VIASIWAALTLATQLLAASPAQGPVVARADNGTAVASAQPAVQQVQFDASRFDSVTVLSLRSFLEVAAEQGIPIGPLVNRALEGAARRVSGVKIMQVVRAHAVALVEAREVLGAGTPVAELDAGATALRAGVDLKSLAAIRASRPIGSATIPLMVLTDIVQRGVPAVEAREAVTTIARLPASDEALKGLQLTVAKNAVRGPGMAVDALNRYLRGTVSGATPSSAPATTDRKPIRPPVP
jgi:hypothetical protein